MITVYVNQFEERLASYAVSRIDINVRDEAYKAIKEEQGQLSEEYEELKKGMNILSETRDIVQGLAQLQFKKSQLEKEWRFECITRRGITREIKDTQ